LSSHGATNAFTLSPVVSIDLGNDGTLEHVNLSGTGEITYPGLVFGPIATQVRVIASGALLGNGFAIQSLGVTAEPDNDATVWTSAIGCASNTGLGYLPVFQDRGIDFFSTSLADPMVLVIGLSKQPVLLPAPAGTACLLLPAPDILLWNPAGQHHVALPAAVRPVTFHVQGVAVTASGLLPTDAFRVAAF